ncbi:MAG: helix-turn-helix domain-containing protein [Phycisphaeraceae bacterium]
MDERDVGANIRRRREAAGLTLTALAERAELTKSTLSKIETGRTSAPVSTLLRIADALGVPLAEFFLEPRDDPPFVLTRKGEGRIITRDGSRFGYAYEALALEMQHKRAEPFLLTIRPGDPVGHFRHGGEEFIHMLAGRLAITVGQHELTLRPGDSLYFDPRHEHTTRVLGNKPAKFLCIFVQDTHKPLGERSEPRGATTETVP